MISILKMKCYGNSHIPYEIEIAAGEQDKVHKFCKILNDYCKTLIGCAQDVKLSMYLNKKKHADQLAQQFVDQGVLSASQANAFAEKLKVLCEGHYVYLGQDVFSVNDVIQI